MTQIKKILKKINSIGEIPKKLLIADSMILISGAMLAPLYAIFVQKIGGSILDASIASGLFALTAGIITLFSGNYVDKIDNEYIIIMLGYLLTGTGFILYIFATNI